MEACANIGLNVHEVGFEVIQLIDLPLRSSIIDILRYDVKRLT
jgi:hypothetical protein